MSCDQTVILYETVVIPEGTPSLMCKQGKDSAHTPHFIPYQ
jgi:hypothetical protein